MLLNLEPRLVLDGSALPAGLADDINWINAHATANVSDAFYSSPSLSNVGSGAQPLWDMLRPYSFQSEDPSSSTTTSTNYDGSVSTLVTHRSVSASYSTGSGSSSWAGFYVLHQDSTNTITGTDSDGHSFTEVHSRSEDIRWQGSGDGAGAAHYKVGHDGTKSDSRDVNGTSTRHESESAEGHVTVEGDVTPSGAVTADYTMTGDFKVGDSLGGGGGGGSGSAPSGLGYTADYSATSDMKLDRKGTYAAGDTEASAIIDSDETGNLVVMDANNGFLGFSRQDGDKVTSTYTAGAPSTPSSPPTTGTVDPNGPTTALVIPNGKTKAYVIDRGDRGWLDWNPEQRRDYIVQNPFAEPGLTGPGIATGEDFVRALGQSGQAFIYAYGADQAVRDLGTAAARTGGQVDVLIISDHGNSTNGQQVGQTFISPLGGATSRPRLDLNNFAAFVKRGGTLVVTGCSVFGSQASVNAWQQYATANNITIMGSASLVGVGEDGAYGVWITLVPGGTAPQIKQP